MIVAVQVQRVGSMTRIVAISVHRVHTGFLLLHLALRAHFGRHDLPRPSGSVRETVRDPHNPAGAHLLRLHLLPDASDEALRGAGLHSTPNHGLRGRFIRIIPVEFARVRLHLLRLLLANPQLVRVPRRTPALLSLRTPRQRLHAAALSVCPTLLHHRVVSGDPQIPPPPVVHSVLAVREEPDSVVAAQSLLHRAVRGQERFRHHFVSAG